MTRQLNGVGNTCKLYPDYRFHRDAKSHMLKRVYRRVVDRIGDVAATTTSDRLATREACSPAVKASQVALTHQFRELFRTGGARPSFSDVQFRVFSQHGEDGILLYLFSLLGTVNKTCVELCCGDGIECNTANLIVNHRWTGALFDGNRENIRQATEFYSSHPDTHIWPPKVRAAWIDRDNVNQLVRDAGISGEIDLLSLDIDGVDYWLWEALDVISPRVVVLEINHLWGPVESVTVPYASDFKAVRTEHGSDYAGASIAAFVSLGRRKGYRLVGANDIATNAFFVRNDLEHPWLEEVDPSVLFWHQRAKFGMEVRLPGVRDMAWERV